MKNERACVDYYFFVTPSLLFLLQQHLFSRAFFVLGGWWRHPPRTKMYGSGLHQGLKSGTREMMTVPVLLYVLSFLGEGGGE
jgi:hypothetical protein